MSFGSHAISFWCPADPEAILDEETLLNSHEQLAWQPYWAQAWDASLGMCHYLVDVALKDRRVLDLGCGLGLTSALLLSAGAEVVCGDNAPPSLLFSRINTWPWRSRCQVREIDWRNTRLDQRFERIIGSDILYDRKEVLPLDRFFRLHLEEEGKVVLGDPSRPMTVEFLTHFRELGWHQRTESVEVSGARQPVRIVTMTLPENG